MCSADRFGSAERVLLAAGTMTYWHGPNFAEPLVTLDGVPDALQCVVEALSGLGYQAEPVRGRGYLLDPSLQQLKDAVRAAARSAPVVVVYYTGHGVKPENGPYYLITAGATPDRLEDTALEARQLLRLVLRKDAHGNVLPGGEQPQVLGILDCCFSGAAGTEALNESLQGMGNPNVWVLASASSVEYAQQGRFAAALRQVLQDPDVGSAQQLLDLNWVAAKINEILGQTGQETRWFPPGGRSTGLTPFFPNPMYVPGVAGLTVAEQHWVSRLRGAPLGTTRAGFYITGRTGRFRVVEDLARWMRDPARGGLAVVTGSPGSGKSAMLALPVLLTDSRTRNTLVAGAQPGSLVTRAVGLFHGLPVLGIHAHGTNPYQVANAIAQHLGRSADSPGELLGDLDDRPEMGPQIVVIDAVDEARDPSKLLADLLLPLARRPSLRVVVGARHRVVPAAADTSLLVDLDSDDYRDPQALAGYAFQLLVAAHEPDVPSPYRDRGDTAVRVAAAIAEKATEPATATGKAESFLLAQLLARAVRGRPQVLDVTRYSWTDQLPADVGAAFDEDLRRLLGKREPAARALMTALAWAKGPGLPWERIWVPVAQALAAQTATGTLHLDRDDVRCLLDNAPAYIVEDIGPGHRSVFRPFHDLLAAHLRGQASNEQAVTCLAGDTCQQRRQQSEKEVTRVLLGTVPASSDGEADWELAHPYLQTYLAQHAHAAGPDTFAKLAADLDYLAVADAAILTPLLTPTDPALRPVARPYRRARALLGDSSRNNSAYLQEAVVAQTGSRPTGQRIRPTYRTLMSRVRRDDSLLTLTCGTGRVYTVAFGTGVEGAPLLASGGGDGAVRLWDPVTGVPASAPLVGAPLAGRTDWVNAVAIGADADGRPLVASGGADGIVWLWDPATGAGHPLWHPGGVNAVAFGVDADGRPLVASGGRDGVVWLWDPATGAPAGDPLYGPNGAVNAVAFGAGADGRPLVASGYSYGTLWLWDLATRTRAGDPLSGHTSTVLSVAFGAGADGRPLLASGGDDGTVRLWDLVTGAPAGNPLPHPGRVNAVAFGAGVDGRSLLASAGSKDEAVRLWDPATGAPVGDPLLGHTLWVNAVAFGAGADGRPLLASGGDDRTVRLWEAYPGSSGPPPMERLHDTVTAVAFGADAGGRSLLATIEGDKIGGDKTVRLWDPTTGDPVGSPAHHPGRVIPVALGASGGGRPLLACIEDDKTVRLWDPTTGDPVGNPLRHPGGVTKVALGASGGGRRLLASGSFDGTIRLWDPATGDPVGEQLSAHIGPVDALAFDVWADGRPLLVSLGYDRTVRLWDPTTGSPAGTSPLPSGGATVVTLGTGADGRPLLASGGDDGMVRLWDPATGTPVCEPLSGHTGPVYTMAFGTGADGRPLLASGGQDGTVRLWDPATGTPIVTLLRRTAPSTIATQNTLLAIVDGEGVAVVELTHNAE